VDSVPAGDRWLHEMKYDGYRLPATGYRLLVAVGGGAARAYPRAKDTLGVPRTYTLDRDTTFGQSIVEEGRKRARLQHHAHEIRAMPGEPLGQNIGIARDNIASQILTIGIDHADMRRLVTHI
jgi:hypothetical protein